MLVNYSYWAMVLPKSILKYQAVHEEPRERKTTWHGKIKFLFFWCVNIFYWIYYGFWESKNQIWRIYEITCNKVISIHNLKKNIFNKKLLIVFKDYKPYLLVLKQCCLYKKSFKRTIVTSFWLNARIEIYHILQIKFILFVQKSNISNLSEMKLRSLSIKCKNA